MSVLDLLQADKVEAGLPAEMAPQTFTDVTSAAFEAHRDNYLSISEARLVGAEFSKSLKAYEEITGVNLEDQLKDQIEEAQKVNQGLSPRDQTQAGETNEQIRRRILNENIVRLRQEDPETYKNLKTYDEAEEAAKEQARQSQAKLDAAVRNATGAFAAVGGSLAGGVLAGLTDPVNLVTMPFGATASQSILRAAAIEAGVNAATEVALQPMVKQWQASIGNDYGFDEAVSNVMFAAVGGAGLTGAIRGTGRAIQVVNELDARAMVVETTRALQEKDALPKSLKAPLDYIEQAIHVKQADPMVKMKAENRSMSQFMSRQHEADLNATMAAIIRQERPLEPNELNIRTKDFNQINTDKTPLMNADDRMRVDEIKRFQNEDSIQPVMENESINNLDLQYERRAAAEKARTNRLKNDKSKITPNAFENVAILRSYNDATGDAVFEFNGKQFKSKGNIVEGKPVEGQAILVRESDVGHDIYPINKDTFVPEDTANSPNALDADNPINVALSPRSDTESIDTQLELFDRMQDSEAVAAQNAQFNRLLEEQPEMRVFDENGNEVMLKDFLKDIEEEEAGLRALQSCATGV